MLAENIRDGAEGVTLRPQPSNYVIRIAIRLSLTKISP
jgi:hypothetical protein